MSGLSATAFFAYASDCAGLSSATLTAAAAKAGGRGRLELLADRRYFVERGGRSRHVAAVERGDAQAFARSESSPGADSSPACAFALAALYFLARIRAATAAAAGLRPPVTSRRLSVCRAGNRFAVNFSVKS